MNMYAVVERKKEIAATYNISGKKEKTDKVFPNTLFSDTIFCGAFLSGIRWSAAIPSERMKSSMKNLSYTADFYAPYFLTAVHK